MEHAPGRRVLLFASVFVIATCGLVYELLTGAVASYLIGNSVTQYSLVIGVFLAAMGLGSYATAWVEDKLLDVFILVQILVGVIGGFSALILFQAYNLSQDMTTVVLIVTTAIGALVGMEIPLLIRILKGREALRVTVSQVLAIDYLGALAASLLFPYLLLPVLGLVRTALCFGLLNLAVAALGTIVFRTELSRRSGLIVALMVSSAMLFIGLASAEKLSRFYEAGMYEDEIILAEDSRYQRIVITRWQQDLRLYLSGHLQFSSADEYRYHESLVDPIMSLASRHPEAERRGLSVLILGGGDGLALARVLQYPKVKRAVLVDLDPRVVELFRDNPLLKTLNKGALSDPRVTIKNDDAFNYLRGQLDEAFDVMIMDLPDPGTTATNKLFSETFYRAATTHLTGVGGFVVQSTSPFYAREAFWCIRNTVQAAADAASKTQRAPLKTFPYHVYVPSFGDWGFVLLTANARGPEDFKTLIKGRYLNDGALRAAFVFPADIGPLKTPINRLDKPVLIDLHNKGWAKWNE